MKIRLKLDMPALADPEITDILSEADMFVRSFSGGNCMLLSPLDMIRIFTTLAEIFSQLFVLWSMSLSSARAFQSTQHWTEVMILAMATFPTLFGFLNSRLSYSTDRWSHSLEEAEGSKLEQTQERMRNLAYSERFKREVLLFGMGEWILNSWADAKSALAIRPTSVMDSTSTAAQTFAHSTSLEFFSLVQTVSRAVRLYGRLTSWTAPSGSPVFLRLSWCSHHVPDDRRAADGDHDGVSDLAAAILPRNLLAWVIQCGAQAGTQTRTSRGGEGRIYAASRRLGDED